MKVTLQTCVPENFPSVDGGLNGGSRVRRTGSEDPHQSERKFCYILICDILILQSKLNDGNRNSDKNHSPFGQEKVTKR